MLNHQRGRVSEVCSVLHSQTLLRSGLRCSIRLQGSSRVDRRQTCLGDVIDPAGHREMPTAGAVIMEELRSRACIGKNSTKIGARVPPAVHTGGPVVHHLSFRVVEPVDPVDPGPRTAARSDTPLGLCCVMTFRPMEATLQRSAARSRRRARLLHSPLSLGPILKAASVIAIL